MSNDNQNQTSKAPPRRPDLYVDSCRGGLWDNRKDGGSVKLTLSITFKEIEQRLQDMRDDAADRDGGRPAQNRENVRDDERPADRREGARGEAREERSSNREDRRPRDAGPRYER